MVTGWGQLLGLGMGYLDIFNLFMPSRLQEVTLTVRENSNCGWYGREEITENMLCAFALGRDSCQVSC